MTNDTKPPAPLDETELDRVTGAGSDHKSWSDLATFSQAVHRPGSDVAMEELTLSHEYITRKS
ncbi:MAG: hypothetical protein AAF293_04315 [Pseudomonadota bacterium]